MKNIVRGIKRKIYGFVKKKFRIDEFEKRISQLEEIIADMDSYKQVRQGVDYLELIRSINIVEKKEDRSNHESN